MAKTPTLNFVFGTLAIPSNSDELTVAAVGGSLCNNRKRRRRR